MKNAAVVATMLALFATPAFADGDTQTTQANTLVVVTPNAPIVIQQGQGPGAQQLGQPDPQEMPPAPLAAPQNEDWNNVSHINGSIVPVGERGAYLKKFKKTNISTNPFGFMYGSYSISASYAVSDNVVIRGDANVGKMIEGGSGVELGVSAPIYFRRAYSGPFLEPGLITRTVNQDEYNYSDYSSMSTTSSAVLFEMMFGWHWSFDSGLNVAAALGAAREIGNSSSDSYSSDDVHFAGYFRVGYEF